MLSAHTLQMCLKKTVQDKDALCALGERKTTFVFKVKDDVSKLPDFFIQRAV